MVDSKGPNRILDICRNEPNESFFLLTSPSPRRHCLKEKDTHLGFLRIGTQIKMMRSSEHTPVARGKMKTSRSHTVRNDGWQHRPSTSGIPEPPFPIARHDRAASASDGVPRKEKIHCGDALGRRETLHPCPATGLQQRSAARMQASTE